MATILLLLVPTAVSVAAVQSEDRSVRAGRDIATTTCVACHIVSPDQTLKPLFDGLAPSFETIANRPATSRQSLVAFLSSTHWDNPVLPIKPAPMRLLPDREKSDVTSYILSLRKEH
jgi:mono/diheme cytochrome c family protein